MLQYVHSGDEDRRVGELRQSFPLLQHLSGIRTLLIEAQVGSRLVVVAEIRRQGSIEMASVQDDVVVQTLPANRADESLGVSILPGTSWCCEDLLDAQRLDSQSNFSTVPLQKLHLPWVSNDRVFDKLKTQLGGLFFQQIDLLVPISLVVVLHALVHVLLAVFQHAVDPSGELVRHGCDSFRRSKLGAQAKLIF